MYQVIPATYENGVLKPGQALSLPDHQQVLLVIVPVPSSTPTGHFDAESVAAMQEQVDNWLAMQSTEAVRSPALLQPARQASAADELAVIVAKIRAVAGQVERGELVADIEAALAEAQSLSPPEAEGLNTELNLILAG